ncbi:MAG: hypothetical protein ACI9WC_000955 [Arenicella sp.]|jgi:hypothetical protein
MFKRTKPPIRNISKFSELGVGDLVVFKPREALPQGISDETLTVDNVGSYDYSGRLSPDFTLVHSSGERYSAFYEPENDTITLGKKLTRDEVFSLFGEEAFAGVFEESGGRLTLETITDSVRNDLGAWIGESYNRTVTAGIAYYYENDKRTSGVSQHEDESMQFTFFELEASNGKNSLSIEIWGDGETDVYCEVTVKSTVVETFLCHA